MDRPTVPLTEAERDAFNSISEQLKGRARRTPVTALALPAWRPSRSSLPLGILVVVLGMAWTVAWLSASVPLSFVGVLAQAGGLGVVIQSQWDRIQAGSAGAVAAADRAQTVQDHPGHRF